MAMILEGYRVIDWSVFHVGPSCAAMLGDLGAEVIKVEPCITGEQMRGVNTWVGTDVTLPEGRHVWFEDLNRNKKGITVDLRTPEGQEIIYRLVDKSDVFVTNYRPSARQRCGVDYESLKARNPRLVYASATAFGDKGPLADQGGIELVGYAYAGSLLHAGSEGAPPTMLPMGIADRIPGVYLAYGVVAALLARERLGVGQEVKTSQLGALTALQSSSVNMALAGRKVPRSSRAPGSNPLYGWFLCKDNRWICLAVHQDRYWPVFCRGIGLPELENDPRFADIEKRCENHDALRSIVDQAFLTRSSTGWRERFAEAGDILVSPVNTMEDVIKDPQVLANDIVFYWDHPTLGHFGEVGFPVRFSETPANLRLPAPELGQHTEEVLTELLGYSWDEVVDLRERGAI